MSCASTRGRSSAQRSSGATSARWSGYFWPPRRPRAGPGRGGGQLADYVVTALRSHFQGALHDDVATDDEALSWLQVPDGFFGHSFNVVQCCNAIGGVVLTKLAESAVAAGDHGRAAIFYGLSGLIDGTPYVLGVGPGLNQGYAERIADDHPFLLSFAQFEALGDEASTRYHRSAELGLRFQLFISMVDERLARHYTRPAELVKHPGGIIEPISILPKLKIAQTHYTQAAHATGFLGGDSVGYCKVEAKCRDVKRSLMAAIRGMIKGAASIAADNPRRFAVLLGAGSQDMIGHPGQFAFPELGDPGERHGYSVAYCEWYVSALGCTSRDFPRHAPSWN